nr:MAG TPA: hypothetical protein [Bacteriophage sp.]
MGYFNIIDSLSDRRVDEGMVSSISKNTKKQNKDTKRMIDAVLSGQISKLSSKDMDISLLVRNDTKLSKNNKKNEKYCIVGTKANILRTEVRGYEINGDYVVAVIGYNLHKGTTVGKAMLWECSNEDVFNKFKEKMEHQGGFDSIYDVNTSMYRSGTTYYDSNRDVYCENTKEALDMIFSYCADSFCSSLSRSDIIEAFSQFETCRLDIASPNKDGMSTSVVVNLYGESDIVDSFYDTIGTEVNKIGSFYRVITYPKDGQVIILFNF